ncbi:MAG: RluA family pseudouridine synthase [Lachnospiraceae bacterium]|nr:RluA family pseudouridine synthase [Lachnospiraceae bacterium]
MKTLTITTLEEGQRFDKYLQKYLRNASKGFIYKMLRKKNITLNGKKADGSEKLANGDMVALFFKEETLEIFTQDANASARANQPTDVLPVKLDILYEDENILLINKPAGMLSQKARREDVSFIEYLTDYLLQSGALTNETLKVFRPGICNRLDRNTSGIIVAGKTLNGLSRMNRHFKDRTIDKYYYSIVKGVIPHKERVTAYLQKNRSHNKVIIKNTYFEGADKIETEYEPVTCNGEYTLVRVKLITGKSHQIRAHLKHIGHPVVGDGKYGDVNTNKYFKKNFKLTHHLLHAGVLVFPTEDMWEHLSGKRIEAPLPKQFKEIVEALFGTVTLP